MNIYIKVSKKQDVDWEKKGIEMRTEWLNKD